MNHKSSEAVLNRSIPIAAFFLAVALVGLTGPSFRVLARQSGANTSGGLIKVTHLVFNHEFDQRRQGPETADALSIRTSRDTPLFHGPFAATDVVPSEAGAGEWIVDPSADGSKSTRNEAALYLRESRQPGGSTTVMVRFEATNVSDAEIYCVPTGPWPGLGPQIVSFINKDPNSELNKYQGLEERSEGGNPPSYTMASGKTAQDYVTFNFTGAFPTSVNRTTPLFAWFAQNVHLKDGSTIDQMTLNVSGLPNPNDSPPITGHEFFTVLETPELPWYDSDERTDPWVIGLRDVTNPKAALGQTTLPDAGRLLSIYLFGFKGFKYESEHGRTKFVEEIDPDEGKAPTQLEDYIRVTSKVVNCYDQAAGLVSYMNLVGATAQFKYKRPYGYIKPLDIVGVGRCNNPFPGIQPLVLPSRDITRSYFGNHAYAVFDGEVYDACAGPEVGVRTERQYWVQTMDEDADILFERETGFRLFELNKSLLLEVTILEP